ncbi:MAG: AAA family ATPase [Deltaproteobacteria bacterium]|nr:AAA family ATPase [Deltaproteobacteria bacterium]
MHCAKCQHENREGARFCEACGSKLELLCPSCGNQVRPGAAFCDNCGTPLTRQSQVPSPRSKVEGNADAKRQPIDSGLSAGERRQLTVMFCDLVGSTALSEQLDPEEWRAVVQEYQRACAEVIRRFEGHIAQYLGDGLLVYFGYPVAHEDDAQRAAQAGLEIVAAFQCLQPVGRQVPSPRGALINQGSTEGQGEGVSIDTAKGKTPFPIPLQVRIGIHTGLVVVGEIGAGGKREQLALGDTPNIAARLQGLAEPDTVVISAATHRLIEGLLDCRDLGSHILKGVSTPLQVYRVIGGGGVRSRLEAAATRGLTPLVGREEEVELLRKRWEQSKAGAGQGVLLSGEAGIGKSRLVQILKDHVAPEMSGRVEYRCSPYYQNSALYPLIDHLQRLLHFDQTESSEEKVRKLEAAVEGGASQEGPLRAEAVALLASLLSLPLPAHYPPLTLTPQRQKQKTLEVLLAWLLKEAERQPVLVVVEDVHWVDPSTLEFLSLLIDRVPTTRVLLLLTFRPDFSPPWAMLSHLTHLTPSRLASRQIEVMVEKVTGGRPLPAEVIQQLITKTDGVPLFVEELTKMVVESGLLREVEGHYELTGPLQPLAIPSTLHDSLIARLDRLATVKDVAQLGASLGREFSYELLQAVSLVDERTLQQALIKLVEAEVLYQRGLPPHARYLFKHALIQDAAYQSLLKSTRQHYHQQIAKVLEARFPETTETQPELLAHHYTEAGLSAQAIPYWQSAGQKASQRSALVEAIAHLTKGLELLKALPDTPEHTQQELDLQITLGPALTSTKGWAAPEVEKTYTRARELCQQVGATSQLFPVLWGLWVFYLNWGEIQTTHELAKQMLHLAQRLQDPALLLEADVALGYTSYYLANFDSAREHAEQGIALYAPQQHHALALLYGGVDPGMVCLCVAAQALWSLGYPAQALKRSHEAILLAQQLAHPHSLAFALGHAARVHQFCQDKQAAYERAEATLTLSTKHRLSFWLAWGTAVGGWALVRQGQKTEGLAQIQQGLAAHQATGAKLWRPYYLALLAEAYENTGRIEEGLTVLAEALAAVDTTEERYY